MTYSATKEAFQRRMISAIERGDNFGLEGWTDFELHDLEFAAELWGAPIAQAAILQELESRDLAAA
jgi:hypothetical protein